MLYLVKKLISLLITLFLTLSASFFLLRMLPGSPFDQDRVLAPEIKANLEAHYGLDKPLVQQYLNYLGAVVHGDLGPSLKYTSRSVNEILADALPVSITLGFFALLLSLSLGLVFGMITALKPRSILGSSLSNFASFSMSVPSFLIAALLVFLFGLQLRWLPVALAEGPEYLVLPVLTLAVAPTAYITRITKASLEELFNQNYVRSALAKGLTKNQVLVRHVLRNSLLPILTVVGPLAAILITGSFVVEQVFSLPGMGKYFITAFINRDYFLVSGVVLVFAFLLLLINTLIELSFPLLEPTLKAK